MFIPHQRIFKQFILLFHGIDRDLNACSQLSLWSPGLAPIPKSPEHLWASAVPLAQYKPWHGHKTACLWCAHKRTTCEHRGGRGGKEMTVLSWRLQRRFVRQHRQMRRIQQWCVLQMMSPSLCVCFLCWFYFCIFYHSSLSALPYREIG